METTDHLFRRESGRLIAALVRIFGLHNLALAEDVAQDTLLRALEVWKFNGPPPNPSAWLMATAKNRAVDVIRRERTKKNFAQDLERFFQSEWTLVPSMDQLLEPQASENDLLRLMFACCHPQLQEDSQIALILHILCGFGVNEVASAFLVSESTMEKRLWRSKKVVAESGRLIEVTGIEDVRRRLESVQRALYLLFNEGYHGASKDFAIREDLCDEALRLGAVLLSHPSSATSSSHALLALMSFHAARLPARVNDEGHLMALVEHDRSRWHRPLIEEGRRLLNLAATGDQLSSFHVEAAIAASHMLARSAQETDWKEIVHLYDTLMKISPSPVVALNRAIAIAQLEGASRGLEELNAVAGAERLEQYPFFAAAMGEFELQLGRAAAAQTHFRTALALARNETERQFLGRRLEVASEKELAKNSPPTRQSG